MSTINEFLVLLKVGRLLPLVNGQKMPDAQLVRNGFLDATSDPKQVEEWHSKGVTGFGLVCRYLILDFDTPESERAFRDLCHSQGFELKTWTTKTPRGCHLFFNVPEGWTASARPGATLAPGCECDIRGLDRSYVVAPPTALDENREYRWLPGYAPWEMELQHAPDWLLERVQGPQVTHAQWPQTAPAHVPQTAHAQWPQTAHSQWPQTAHALTSINAETAPAGGTDGTRPVTADAVPDDPELIERLKQRFLSRAIRRAVPGNRNRELCQLAAQLRDMRIPMEEAQALAVGAWWPQIDNTGFSRREVLATVRGIYKRPPREFPRGFYQDAAVSSDGDFTAMLDAEWTAEPVLVAGETGFEMRIIDPMQVRQPDLPSREWLMENIGDGVLGQLYRVMVDTAPRQQPWISIGAALCTLGAVMGRRFMFGPYGTRTNLYVIATAPTGSGKEHARTVAKAVLEAAELGTVLGDQRLRSGSRIVGSLLNNARQLCLVDEFGMFIKSISGRGVPFYRAEIRETLMSLYSASGSSYGTPDPGGSDTRTDGLMIQQPCLCLYATSTPEELWNGLTSGDAVSGFINRFLLFSSFNALPPRNKPKPGQQFDITPKRLIDGIRALDMGHGMGNLEMHTDSTNRETGNVVRYEPHRVETDEEGAMVLDQFGERIDALRANAIEQGNAQLASLLARTEEQAFKVALIRAAGDNLVDPVVTGEIARWAAALVESCTWDLVEQIGQNVAVNEVEGEHKRMLRVITEAGPEGITLSKLNAATQWVRKTPRRELLESLVESGDIIEVERKPNGPGRPSRRLIATIHLQRPVM